MTWLGKQSFCIRSATTLLAVAMIATTANAQITVPWTVSGRGGSGPEGFSIAGETLPFNAQGSSFPVGRYGSVEPQGTATADPASLQLQFENEQLVGFSGDFFGDFTFVNRRSGDRLVTTYGVDGPRSPGRFLSIPAGAGKVRVLFVAEFSPVAEESTGRFNSVSGGSVVIFALTNPIRLSEFDFETGRSPAFRFNWFGIGNLTFG